MPSKPSASTKSHITGTVDQRIEAAMITYRNDPRNKIADEKPSKSWIIQSALERFLKVYLPKSNLPVEKL